MIKRQISITHIDHVNLIRLRNFLNAEPTEFFVEILELEKEELISIARNDNKIIQYVRANHVVSLSDDMGLEIFPYYKSFEKSREVLCPLKQFSPCVGRECAAYNECINSCFLIGLSSVIDATKCMGKLIAELEKMNENIDNITTAYLDKD